MVIKNNTKLLIFSIAIVVFHTIYGAHSSITPTSLTQKSFSPLQRSSSLHSIESTPPSLLSRRKSLSSSTLLLNSQDSPILGRNNSLHSIDSTPSSSPSSSPVLSRRSSLKLKPSTSSSVNDMVKNLEQNKKQEKIELKKNLESSGQNLGVDTIKQLTEHSNFNKEMVEWVNKNPKALKMDHGELMIETNPTQYSNESDLLSKITNTAKSVANFIAPSPIVPARQLEFKNNTWKDKRQNPELANKLNEALKKITDAQKNKINPNDYIPLFQKHKDFDQDMINWLQDQKNTDNIKFIKKDENNNINQDSIGIKINDDLKPMDNNLTFFKDSWYDVNVKDQKETYEKKREEEQRPKPLNSKKPENNHLAQTKLEKQTESEKQKQTELEKQAELEKNKLEEQQNKSLSISLLQQNKSVRNFSKEKLQKIGERLKNIKDNNNQNNTPERRVFDILEKIKKIYKTIDIRNVKKEDLNGLKKAFETIKVDDITSILNNNSTSISDHINAYKLMQIGRALMEGLEMGKIGNLTLDECTELEAHFKEKLQEIKNNTKNSMIKKQIDAALDPTVFEKASDIAVKTYEFGKNNPIKTIAAIIVIGLILGSIFDNI